MQLTDYLYAAPASDTSDKALIILPEIYGVQDFTRNLAKQVTTETGLSGYVLDHFYAVTGQAEVIDYNDQARGMAIMQEMTGEAYLGLFQQAVRAVKQRQPQLKRLAVWGFCFGGKLAWLSGTQAEVTDIISFYGGASLARGFYRGGSVVEALCTARRGDAALRVLGAFGEADPMIPVSDREGIEQAFAAADIAHQLHVYEAGHAFYNEDRSTYVASAAEQSWHDVQAWLKSSPRD